MKTKQFTILFLHLFLVGFVNGQQSPKKEHLILNNMQRVTDGNTPLAAIYSDYDFPYYVPDKEDIEEKLSRIANYLEKSTASGIVDSETGVPITNYKNLNRPFDLAESDYRILTYTWGVTYTGMLRAYNATGNSIFRDYAVQRFQLLSNVLPSAELLMSKNSDYRPSFNRILNPKTLDHSGAMCAAMIQWSRSDELDFSLQKYIDNLADFISNDQYRLADGTIARKEPYESTLWLDDLYMGVPALVQLYLLTNDSFYLEDAVRQILQFSERMFVLKENLYMHSYVTTMSIHPEFFWGRANGWAMLALCDLLDALPENHPKYHAVLSQYQKFCFGLLKMQAKNGMWHQLLDRNDSYLESSATAMFVYGFTKGINNGWLDNRVFGPSALLGWNGLSEQINNMGQIENVCVGTGVSYDPAYYYYRHVHVYTAHGFGPVLMAGSEILTLIDKFKISRGNVIYFHNRKSDNDL